jgi:O-antigen/teichoic acid export membrane protein
VTATAGDTRLGVADVRRRAVRGALSVGVRNLAVRGLGLVGVVILSRLLDPHAFGLLAFGFTLRVLCDIISAGGLAAGLVRREAEPTREEFAGMAFFQLGVALLLIALTALAGLAFGDTAFLAAIMLLALPITILRVPSVITFERRLQWDLIARAEVTEMVVYNVVAIGLVLLGAGVWGVAAASAVQAATGTAILLVKGPVGLVLPRPRIAEVRRLLGFGAKFQAVAVVTVARDQGLNLVVAAAGGVAALGIWSIAYRVLQAILLLLQSLWRVSYPATARALEAGDSADDLVQSLLRVSTTIVAVPALLLAGTAPVLVHVVFGAEWADAAAILPWGAAAIVVWGGVSTATAGFLQARGDVTRFLLVVLMQTLAWFDVTIWLMPDLGAESVGIGMLVAAVFYVAGISLVMRDHARLALVRVTWPAYTACVAGAVAARLLTEAIAPDVPALAAGLVAGGVVYLAVLWVLRRSDLVRVVNLARDRGRAPVAA